MTKPDKIILRDEERGPKKDDASEETVFAALVKEEEGHDIRFRTLSWQKTTLLLFGEYVCLAILALPWSFSVLGWGAGLCCQIVMGLLTWYTSYVLWQFCMKHPDARDVCEIAAKLFPRFPRLAYEATNAMLLLNNIFVIGFHIFTGAKVLNTLSDGSVCTVGFQGVTAVIGIIFSMPRTLKHVSFLSIFSATAMGIAILLSLIFSGIMEHPGPKQGAVSGYPAYPTLGPVKTHGGLPNPKLSFVAGFNAFLNITFLWIGQILYPSFIAEMENPRDFPKALAALTFMEMVLFLVVSVVGYHYMGQYAQAPMIGALLEPWMRKAAFAFVIVPTVIIAVIYSNVTVKVIFHRLLGKSRHAHSHTFAGWGAWGGITTLIWIIGFLLGNVIPSMGDFLAIMSAAFDSFFGFIFWAVAYWHINRDRLWSTPFMCVMSIFNIFIFAFGFVMLGPGLYTAVQAIIDDYAGPVKKPFSCASNGL